METTPSSEPGARGVRIGWNWGAFFFSTAEFWRWRMPGFAGANVAFLTAGFAASLFCAMNFGSWIAFAAFVFASYLVLPSFFDCLVSLRTERAERNPRSVGKPLLVAIRAVGLAASLLLPGALESTIDAFMRIHVREIVTKSEGALAHMHEKLGRLPDRGEVDAQEVRVGEVAQVRERWDDERRVLHVELETTIAERIQAQFVLRPELDARGALVDVTCFNVSIPVRWLPAQCRADWK